MEEQETEQTLQGEQQTELRKGEKDRRLPLFFGGMAAGIAVCVLIGAGVFAGKSIYGLVKTQGGAQSESSVVNAETIQKMRSLESVIEKYYYDYKDEPTTEENLQTGIYKGMTEALNDPYSEYYTAEELKEVVDGNNGVSYGIGAYITLDKEQDMAVIAGVMEGTPAEEAGLKEGDVIYKIDGEETRGLSTSRVVSLVKGKEGTTVHLTIYREGEADFLEVDIVRSKLIETTTVRYGMVEGEEGIGYLQITEFDTVTLDQFNEAMAELRADDMKGLILDLRSNPGGDLSVVVEIARRLLPAGLITYTEVPSGQRSEYTCDGEYEIDIPMVVLINGYSASAAEILAGAIQEHNKGTVVGTTSYGKGIVQRLITLEDGSAVKLTVSGWFTPNGNNIQGSGIEPDVETEYDTDLAETEGLDSQVEKGIEILKEKIG